MKKATKFLAIAIAVLSFSTAVAQQGARLQNAKTKMQAVKNETPAQRAKPYSDTLKNVCGLSDEQYQKVLAINTDFITKRDDLRKSMAADTTGQMKMQMKTLKQSRSSQIKAVLTPDQQAKWTAWKKEKAQGMKSSKQGMMNNDPDGM